VKRKPLVCANWKLHHLLAQTLTYLSEVKKDTDDVGPIDLVVAPVAPLLYAACEQTKGSRIQVAAQNVFYEKQGAFTGEWSVAHLQELGCMFAIVGHSERRQYFAESDESVAKKVRACFEGGITPIACVGETLEQRKLGEVASVLNRQVDFVISQVAAEEASQLVIAYEPVWHTASSETYSHVVLGLKSRTRFGLFTAVRSRLKTLVNSPNSQTSTARS
jgi:triosephosphate isomerase